MNYSIISKYRTHIMGIATLWIAVLHATMWFPVEPINWIFKSLGQNGVDIFFFLSSFGLYYAYQKDKNPKSFLYKRFIRILPTYIPVVLFCWYYEHYSMGKGFLVLSSLYFWVTGERTKWYISAILVLYLFTPFYLKRFEKNEVKMTIISIILSFVLGACFFNGPFTVFFARIPMFLLGFLVGYWSYNKKEISKKEYFLQVASFILGFAIFAFSYATFDEYFLWDYGLYFYPMLLIVIPFCLLFAQLFDFLNRHSIPLINDMFYKVGVVSLQFYLLHEVLLRVIPHIIVVTDYYSAYGIVFNVLVIFITYYVSKYFKDAIDYLMRLCHVR